MNADRMPDGQFAPGNTLLNEANKPYRWQPGQSGNPGGKPGRTAIIRKKMQDFLEENAELFFKRTREVWEKGADDDFIKSSTLFLSHVIGMPKQSIDVTLPEDDPWLIQQRKIMTTLAALHASMRNEANEFTDTHLLALPSSDGEQPGP